MQCGIAYYIGEAVIANMYFALIRIGLIDIEEEETNTNNLKQDFEDYEQHELETMWQVSTIVSRVLYTAIGYATCYGIAILFS